MTATVSVPGYSLVKLTSSTDTRLALDVSNFLAANPGSEVQGDVVFLHNEYVQWIRVPINN